MDVTLGEIIAEKAQSLTAQSLTTRSHTATNGFSDKKTNDPSTDS